MTEKNKSKEIPPLSDSPPDFEEVVSALLQVPKENIKKPEPKKKKEKSKKSE